MKFRICANIMFCLILQWTWLSISYIYIYIFIVVFIVSVSDPRMNFRLFGRLLVEYSELFCVLLVFMYVKDEIVYLCILEFK